jgi:hypothetical protein
MSTEYSKFLYPNGTVPFVNLRFYEGFNLNKESNVAY